MKKEEAAEQTITGVAYCMEGLMFWGENTGYWSQKSSGKIEKCNAPEPREDWQPARIPSKEFQLFQTRMDCKDG